MDISGLRAVIADDDIFKAVHIRGILEAQGIRKIKIVSDQERLWEEIYREQEGNADTSERVGLIVTDMHYPLRRGGAPDGEAGFRLIERLEQEGLRIPVIVCSSKNYSVPEVLGSVWYSPLNNIEQGFREALGKYENRE